MQQQKVISNNKQSKRIGYLFVLFVILFILSFAIGRFYVPIKEVVRILVGQYLEIPETWTHQMEVVVMNVRLPRIIAAIFIGGALAVAGCVYQGLFKNPMVSPDILGSSAGSGFGAALGILLGLNSTGITTSAFTFGIGAVGLSLVVAMRYKQNLILGLVLAGLMVGSIFSAGTSFIKLVADPTNQLPEITYWLMGSLGGIRVEHLYLLCPCVIIGILPLILLQWRLNVLAQGDEEARALGVNVTLLRIVAISCATLMTSACVAVSGMIGWVGLMIPHLARRIVGYDYRYLIPTSVLIGGSFMMVVDNLSRSMLSSEIPIGILTAFIGAPFFLQMLLKGGQT